MNNLPKLKSLIAIVFALSPVLLMAQSDTIFLKEKAKNIAWFTPCGATKINGVAIGVQAMNVDGKKLTINGINVDAGMGGVVATFYGLFSSFPFKKKTNLEFLISDSAATSIKGISISMGGELAVSITGINIAGGTKGIYQLKGISITRIYTKTLSFDGICISGIHNIANKGVGIQIGLFNYCKNLKGFQIGLWNKSGNRGLPFINWGI